MDEKMMQESLKQFFQMASQDLELQEKLKASPNREAYVRSCVELGKEKGYSFTSNQVVTALDTAADPAAKEEELADEELEQVAGGAFTCIAETRGETQIPDEPPPAPLPPPNPPPTAPLPPDLPPLPPSP